MIEYPPAAVGALNMNERNRRFQFRRHQPAEMPPGLQCFTVVEQDRKIDAVRQVVYCLTRRESLGDVDNIFKLCIKHSRSPHGAAELRYHIMISLEYVYYLLCRTYINDLRAVQDYTYAHIIIDLILQDKDLSIKKELLIMKLTDILIAIIALVLAYFIIQILWVLLTLTFFVIKIVVILIVAYIVYLFIKKVL